MDISDAIVRMRDNIISNKELNKKQFIEINNAILAMARDRFFKTIFKVGKELNLISTIRQTTSKTALISIIYTRFFSCIGRSYKRVKKTPFI